MIFRLTSLAFATTVLISCTPAEQDKYYNYHHGGHSTEKQEKTLIPITDPHGINMNMMDYRLQEMVNEANDIETQVAALVDRLTQLREDVSGLALVNKVSVVADPNPHAAKVEIAKPQPLVPEVNNNAVVTETVGHAVQPSEQKEAIVAENKPLQQPKQEAAAKVSKTAGVFDVRVGVHPGKTRLVLDINGSLENKMNFDPEAGIVTITLPKTEWSAAPSKTYKLQQLSGYEAKSSDGGTIVALAVKDTSSVKLEGIKSTGAKASRLVIDLVK